MKLLLICLDGVRADLVFPEAVAADPSFAEPDHPSDPRFGAGAHDGTTPPDEAPRPAAFAPTLRRLATGNALSEGRVIPMWMTPPTDSGPGWASILTGATHEECNVWWNEFVGHDLARNPDLLSRVFFANPKARTLAAATWDAFTDPAGPGPIIHQRVDQQRTGQHQLFHPDLRRGITAADAAVCQWASWKLLHEGPDAAVVYFEGVDAAGHKYGADSEEYRAAISRVDEHTRYLVKAVSERHEQLGEDWLIAVTTDHGHKAAGGHGEDEVEVRRSFLAVHRVGGRLPDAVRDASSLRSHQVMGLLLEAIGARQGSLDAPGLGVLTDIEPVGPTRDLAFEW
ncbi:Type I phosphodiesterase / nucleotide pyrophosphatase [Tessaracoccus bendigoensis DSM 12906]|uniref:Type I phosphodiesterase / nucleotide pyrophosphatase n=1 Tax=Tessaracoccus bendigoensis DSM 12906 TaxID=1123357 RepID=A0A1M6MGU0_9ACTN|nr:alkaline phosphatase family protein [Tessaracoccus bendigoensis]SHJ82596.1 Type I phosphodiesterase / nucleotide pyrophosphatase [Tessaracoccus bendigoensis DSM 12906]